MRTRAFSTMKFCRNWIAITALVILASLGTACNPEDRTTMVTPSPTPYVAPTATPMMNGPITDLGTVWTNTNRADLAGREVRLTSVPVMRVVNNNAFWVGTDTTQRLLVVTNTPMTASSDNNANVKQGQMVDLTGMMRQIPSADQMRTNWKFSSAAAQDASGEQIYLDAQQVIRQR